MKLLNNLFRVGSSYLLNNLRIFNEFFRKDVTYDNIKSHKKTLSLERTFLEKPLGGIINRPEKTPYLETFHTGYRKIMN